MDTPDLSPIDRIRLSRVAAKCDELKSRLEAHGFRVIKFRVEVSPDNADLVSKLPIYIDRTLADVTVNVTLAFDEVEVAALAR